MISRSTYYLITCYTVLTRPNKVETAIHGCSSSLSVVVFPLSFLRSICLASLFSSLNGCILATVSEYTVQHATLHEDYLSTAKYSLVQCEGFLFLHYFLILLIVDGGFSNWSNWTACSVSCGTGFELRQRTCTNPLPMHGGKLCESRSSVDVRICFTEDCNPQGK